MLFTDKPWGSIRPSKPSSQLEKRWEDKGLEEKQGEREERAK
jgi:hypothetical protein